MWGAQHWSKDRPLPQGHCCSMKSTLVLRPQRAYNPRILTHARAGGKSGKGQEFGFAPGFTGICTKNPPRRRSLAGTANSGRTRHGKCGMHKGAYVHAAQRRLAQLVGAGGDCEHGGRRQTRQPGRTAKFFSFGTGPDSFCIWADSLHTGPDSFFSGARRGMKSCRSPLAAVHARAWASTPPSAVMTAQTVPSYGGREP